MQRGKTFVPISRDRGRVDQSRELCFLNCFPCENVRLTSVLRAPTTSNHIFKRCTSIYIKSHGRMIPRFRAFALTVLPSWFRYTSFYLMSHKTELHVPLFCESMLQFLLRSIDSPTSYCFSRSFSFEISRNKYSSYLSSIDAIIRRQSSNIFRNLVK